MRLSDEGHQSIHLCQIPRRHRGHNRQPPDDALKGFGHVDDAQVSASRVASVCRLPSPLGRRSQYFKKFYSFWPDIASRGLKSERNAITIYRDFVPLGSNSAIDGLCR
jgi:hypothetical protein